MSVVCNAINFRKAVEVLSRMTNPALLLVRYGSSEHVEQRKKGGKTAAKLHKASAHKKTVVTVGVE